jgi:hypothetical protein
MNRITKLLLILLLVASASAAVYVTTNPEACLYFFRDSPGPDVLPVQTLIQCGEGWSNSCDWGKMDSNLLETDIYHKNTQAENVVGIVYLEIECEEGLVDKSDGIKDFSSIMFTDPHGCNYSCNTNAHIERISNNHIKIVPTTAPFEYVYGTIVYSNIVIDFVDYAYGNYTLTVYVDT